MYSLAELDRINLERHNHTLRGGRIVSFFLNNGRLFTSCFRTEISDMNVAWDIVQQSWVWDADADGYYECSSANLRKTAEATGRTEAELLAMEEPDYEALALEQWSEE